MSAVWGLKFSLGVGVGGGAHRPRLALQLQPPAQSWVLYPLLSDLQTATRVGLTQRESTCWPTLFRHASADAGMTTPQQEATPDGQFVQPLPEYRPNALQLEAPQKHWPEELVADGAVGAVVVLPGAAVGRGVGYRTVPDGAVRTGVGVG